MDNFEINNLVKFITNELHVDIPLYHNNANRAVKFDFEDMSIKRTKEVINAIVCLLFGSRPFWVCEYGSVTGEAMLNHGLFATTPKIEIVPYISSVDRDYFEYDHDAIACVHSDLGKFCVRKYIEYVLEREFISNHIFLIDEVNEIALYVYDRRGMDVASTNYSVLERLFKRFSFCISKSILN